MRRFPVLPFAAAVALATATGVVAVVPFPLETLPAADLGLGWSPRALSPDEARDAALRHLLRVLAALLAVAGAVAVGALTLLMGGRALGRRREIAVRAALGAGSTRLRAQLLREAAPALATGAALGMAAGAGALGLIGATWPGARPGEMAGLAGAMGTVAAVGILLLVALPLALLPARWSRGALAPLLAAGERATADRHEGGGRRLLVGALMTMTLALLSGGFGVARSGAAQSERGLAAADDGLLILPLAAVGDGGDPSDWARLADAAGAIPGVRAESIASAGAWAGLGTRDFALADCGSCVIGGLLVPFRGSAAHHHAVSTGFFDSAGLAVLDGRGFAETDGPASPPVAVVSRAFALSHYDQGRPVGRLLRVGRSPERWFRVIGVVEDASGPALGRGARPEPAVYLSALQHPPDRLELAVRGAEAEDGAALVRAAAAAGFRLVGPAATPGAYRATHAGPLRWWGRVVAAAGALALLLALCAVHEMARMEAAARRREMAVRAALGARPRTILRGVLGRVARVGALAAVAAIPGAVAVGAALQRIAAGVPVFDPLAHGALALLVTAAGALGALRPARAAARVAPGEALAGR